MNRKQTSQLCCLLLALAAGCNPAPPQAPPQMKPKVTVVKPIQKKIVHWDQYTGRMAPVQLVEIRARVSGYLKSIHFEEGQYVNAGELLFVIDPRPLEAALSSAKAQLKEAEARLKQAQSLERQAEAQTAQANAKQALAQQRKDRAANLLQRNVVSQEDFEERASELLQAVADVEAAKANIEATKAGVETANAAIVVAQAAVENAELDLGYTQIKAPIAGRASKHYITQGNLIDGGSTQSSLLTTIVSLDPIHCYFDGNEREVLNYMRMIESGEREDTRVGEFRMPVYLKLVDETGYPHLGHIDFVDNRIDVNTGTMRARAIFPNANHFLTPGMFAEVRLPGSRPHEAVLIPDSAVGTDQSETFVYIVGGGEKVERRSVVLGPLSHGLRIINKGLDGSERLVVSGLQTIRPGVEVEATETQLEFVESAELPDHYEPVPKDKWLSSQPAELDRAAAPSAQ